MSISQAINAARTGLQISGLRAELVATNVSNAATPGYVRRSLDVSELSIGDQSSGVLANGINRSTDESLTAQRRTITSDQASASVLASTWESLTFRLGDTTEGPGLFNTLRSFETALADAALSPESTIALTAVVNTATDVTTEFADLSEHVETLRSEADSEIAAGVDRVNAALDRIVSLNASIAKAGPNSAEAAALYDERDRMLDTISEYLPIQTVPQDNGTIDVVTQEGVSLVAGSARKIEFTPSLDFRPSQTIENGDLSGLKVGDIDITPGASSFGAVSSGMFGALYQLRDRDLPEFNDQIDTLATDLVSRLSDDALDGTKTPGDPGIFLDSGIAGEPGIASRLQINAAIDPEQGGATWRLRDGLGATVEGPPGNTATLDNLLNAITSNNPINAGQLQGQFSTTGMAAELSSLTGFRQVTMDALNSSTQTQLNILNEAEITQTGVNIDDQLQDLLIIEQSYSANARVIEAAGQMIDRLLEL